MISIWKYIANVFNKAINSFQGLFSGIHYSEELTGILLKNIVFLTPIFLLSVFALALIIDRCSFFLKIRLHEKDFVKKAVISIRNNRMRKLFGMLKREKGPEAYLLREVCRHLTGGKPGKTKHIVGSIATEALGFLEARLSLLPGLANIATLMGLLGTVTGMILSFYGMNISGLNDPRAVADGISQALFTTAAGLMSAIPSIFFYHIFLNIVRKRTENLEILARELLAYIEERDE